MLSITDIGQLCVIHDYLTKTGHGDWWRDEIGQRLDKEFEALALRFKKEKEDGERHSK